MSVEAGASDGAPGADCGGGGQRVNNDIIRLLSCDGKEFRVPIAVARVSFTIRSMLDLFGDDVGQDDAVPLTNVRGDIFQRVIAWAVHHKDDPTIEKCTVLKNVISPWDMEFLEELPLPILSDLILAANYLDIKVLLDCTCQTVANMIKGKTPEEIRATFNIQNDLTLAEEEQIRVENEFIV